MRDYIEVVQRVMIQAAELHFRAILNLMHTAAPLHKVCGPESRSITHSTACYHVLRFDGASSASVSLCTDQQNPWSGIVNGRVAEGQSVVC